MGGASIPANPVSVRLASRPLAACLAVFLFTLGVRAALLPVLHVPMPAVHDEFSYLLAADTYASGRLTNPPHPFWKHFESFHIIQQPTYASKYPPLQGLVLAFGERFFDRAFDHAPDKAWIGVWLSAGLMCGAVCWMFQGWITPGPAFLGALLVALRVGILSSWMNSYWGGAVPAIGGALLLGAAARIAFQRRYAHSVTWAIGLAILLNSRPYEGAALAVLSGAMIVWKTAPVSTLVSRVARPAAAVLIPVALFMLYYNACVTGHPFELPYQLHERQYGAAPVFAWSRANPAPVYHHAVMQTFWTKVNLAQVKEAQARLLPDFLLKLATMYGFFFCFYPLFLPALIWPYPLQTPQERATVLLLGGGLAALIPVAGFQYHYAAAIMPLIYLRFLQSMDRLRNWRPRPNHPDRNPASGALRFARVLWKRKGRGAHHSADGNPFGPEVRFAPLAQKPWGVALAVLLIALIPIQFGRDVWKLFADGEYALPMAQPYHDMVRQLEALPGRHLVMVRYAPHHDVFQEWVYNRADIDSARIVWAREMSPTEDAPLIQYFHGRSVWLLEPDQSPPKLTPYATAPSAFLSSRVR